MAEKRKRIGEYLIEKGIITTEQLDEAMDESKRLGVKIGDSLVKLGYATEEQIISILSEQLGFAFIDVANYQIDPVSIALVPRDLAEQHQAIAVYKIGSTLTVAMIDPLNIDAVDDLERATNLSINPVFGTASGIEAAISKYYGETDIPLAGTAPSPSVSGEAPTAMATEEITDAIEEATQAPVINLVQDIIVEAVKRKASDIHIEPQEKGFYRRFRIDGILEKPKALPKELYLILYFP